MKGFYTIEVLIAVSLILMTMVFVFRSPVLRPELEISLMKNQAFDALEYLDTKDELREYVKTRNETAIETRLREMLPESMLFEISFGKNCDRKNVPSDKMVIKVTYYLAGDIRYDFNKVCLFVWKRY